MALRRGSVARRDTPAPPIQRGSFRASLLAVLLVDASILGAWAAWTHPGPRDLGRIGFMVAISLPFLVVAATQPTVRRIAFATQRRRWRSGLGLVAAGALAACVTTTTITVADALHHAPDAVVRDHLGPVDELVVAATAPDRIAAQDAITGAIASDLAIAAPNPLDEAIDGQLALTTLDVRVEHPQGRATTGSVGPGAGSDATAIEIDVPTAQRFGGDVDATGFRGVAPLSAGHVLVGHDLAADLRVRAKDNVRLQLGNRDVRLVVDRVLPRTGIAALTTTAAPRPRVLFVAPGTLTTLASDARGAARPAYLLAISNSGGVDRGVDLSGVVSGRLEKLFEPQVQNSIGAGGGFGATQRAGVTATVFAVKHELLGLEERTTGRARDLFAALGSAVVLAAIALFLRVGQSFVRARRTELASVRVLGMRRLDAVSALGIEGWLVALAVSIVGTVGGLILAVALRSAAAAAPSATGSVLAVELRQRSVVESAALSFGVMVLALLMALAWLASRTPMDTLRGSRPSNHSQPTRAYAWVTALAVAFALLGAAVTGRSAALVITLPAIIGLGALALLTRLGRVIRPKAVIVVATIAALWAVAGRFVWPGLLKQADERAFLMAAFTGIACLSIAVTVAGHPVRRLLPQRTNRSPGKARKRRPRTTPGAAVARRIAMSGLRSDPWRSGLTLASIAAVLLTLTATSLASATIDSSLASDVRSAAGGWQLTANDAAVLDERDKPPVGIAEVATFSTARLEASRPGNPATATLLAYGFDRRYIDGGPAALARRSKGLSIDQAWRATLNDPKSVIVDAVRVPANADGSGIKPGDQLFLRDVGSGRSLTLIVTATLRSSAGLAPVLLGTRALSGMARDETGPKPAVARLRAGTSIAQWRNGAPPNLRAGLRTFKEAVADQELPTIQITSILRWFLLVAAVLSLVCLGTLAAADLRNRVDALAALRTVGLRRQDLRRLVLTEGHVLFAEGAVLGVALGAFAATWLIARGLVGHQAGIAVPVVRLVIVLIAGAVGVAALTWLPNRKIFESSLPGRTH